jgi:hypothetical protein
VNKAEAYIKGVAIADLLLARGFPVIQVEAPFGDELVFSFGGPRAQQIHANAGEATYESVRDAYERGPP